MKNVASKIKPKSGFSYFIHLFFVALVPTLVYVTIRVDLVPVALLVILLGKWRIFAVQPRHWWAHLRANAVDILFGLATLGAMVEASSQGLQIVLAVMYGLWLLLLKPRSTPFFVSLQALIAQTYALTTMYLLWGGASIFLLVLATGIVGYLCARHFMASFDEPHAPLYAHSWGYFNAALAWVLSHWLVYFPGPPDGGPVAQIVLLITTLGFGFASLYYLEQKDKLSIIIRRQILFLMLAITVVVLVFSEWGDKAI
jgi:hypothetical protein